MAIGIVPVPTRFSEVEHTLSNEPEGNDNENKPRDGARH